MRKKQKLFPKASLVQALPKDFHKLSNSVLLPCPPHRIAPPWEPEHLPRTSSAQLPFHSSHRTTPAPPPLPWHKLQATNTGPLPYLKYQGMMRSFPPKKSHTNTLGLTLPSSDFKSKATVVHPTSSKKFVMPPLVSVHKSKTSVKLKHLPVATSGTDSLPKISPAHDCNGKQKLSYHWIACHQMATAPPSTKQKRSKTMHEPLASPHPQTSSSSVHTSKSHTEKVHRSSKCQHKVATTLLGGLDLWPKDVVIELPSSEDHSNATDSEKTSDQPLPETPPLLKPPLSKKERPILTPSETAILSLTFNNKCRDKPVTSSFTKFIDRGTNTYTPWPPNKSTSPGPNHQAKLNAKLSPDFIPWARTQSVPSLPLKIWETSLPQTTVTQPAHVAEASLGPNYKVKDKDTFGPSPHPVRPVIIPLPGHNQSSEIPPGLKDQATDLWGLYYWFEVSRGQEHQDSTSKSQNSISKAANISKTPAITVLSFLTESTPNPRLLSKSSLIAGDQRSRDPFGLDQDVKTPKYSHPWLPPSIFSEYPGESIIGLDFQALMEQDNQLTLEMKPHSQVLSQPNPKDQVISPPILDHQLESAPDDKARVTLHPDSDHWVKMSLRPDHQVSHPPSTNKLAEIESKSTTTQDLPPIDPEDQIRQISPLFNPKQSVTPSSDSSDQKDTPTGSDYHKSKETLTFDYHDEAQSGLQSQNPVVQNREIPWRLKYIKPYTIKGGTLSAETVSAIINSIPEEKIKNDMCKQILLRRMKESLPQKPGHRMSLSYTVCLECASWIPNSCPHVEEMNNLSETELLVIPMPLPDSEEMGVKFVLRVPQKKTFSFFSTLFPEYEIYWPSRRSSDLSSSSATEPYGCPRVIRLHPSSSSSDTEPHESPQVTLFDLILGKNQQSSEKKSPKHQQPCREETLMESEDDGKEKLRVLARGFTSLLDKFEKQMKS